MKTLISFKKPWGFRVYNANKRRKPTNPQRFH